MPCARIAPGLVRQEGDLGRRHPEPADVEQEEVVQRIGADGAFRRLDHPILGRHQLGRNLGVQNGVQRVTRARADQVACRHPADQMPDQRLRHPAVDIVMAHMVADAIGGPAQRQFRQVPGPQHKGPVLIGQPEQIIGPQPRLHVLEGDVVHRLTLGVGVADVLEHLFGGGADVDLGARDAQRGHQRPGVGLGPVRGREPRHGEAQDIGPRQIQPVEGAARDQQGLGRIQPAGHADHQRLGAGRRHAAHQPLNLDIERLIAVLIQPPGVVRHEGEPVQRPDQFAGLIILARHEGHDRRRLAFVSRTFGEGAVPQSVQPDSAHVHVGDGQMAV